jgi:predicted dehydrogenase
VKILIAGLGSIGRRHLRNLLALGQRDLVLYRTKHSTLPDEELADFIVETNLQSALKHNPQAAIIANPTSLHLDVAIPCARAGCHLLIEKPVSHSMDRIAEFKSAVQDNGIRTLIGYHFRQHPNLHRIKEMLLSGDIGSPVSVNAHWGEYLPDWHPWEDYRAGYSAREDLGGGVILTLSHPLDYLRWIFGDIESLWASYSKTGALGIKVDDLANIGVRFNNGLLGSVHLDYLQRPGQHWLEVITTKGYMHWEAAGGNLKVFRSEPGQWQEYPMPPEFSRNDLFLAEMRHFLQVCQGAEQTLCSLQDGIEALRLAIAAYSSQDSGRLIFLKNTAVV